MEKTRQNAENDQTFDLNRTERLKLRGKTPQNAENKQTSHPNMNENEMTLKTMIFSLKNIFA